MKLRTVLLLSLLFALLQGPFLSPVFLEGLLVVLILSVGIAGSANKVMLQLFLSGLVFDFVQGTQLGVTSIIFIMIALMINLLRETIPYRRPNFAAVLAFGVVVLRGKILFTNFFLTEALLSAVLVFLLLNFFWRPIQDNRLEIR